MGGHLRGCCVIFLSLSEVVIFIWYECIGQRRHGTMLGIRADGTLQQVKHRGVGGLAR